MVKLKLYKDLVLLDVILNCRIKETAKMILDTGASHVTISRTFAEYLGLDMSNCEKVSATAVNETVEVRLISLDSVTILGKEVKNLKVMVCDLPLGSNIDGLIGLSFLKNFNVYLNFRSDELEII